MKNILFALMLLGIAGFSHAQISFRCGDILTDERDGREYRTVQIGNQCWMQENLNIGTPRINMEQSDNQIVEKTCYNNDEENCETYGGLYTWDEAMNYGASEAGDICPEGWHIPGNEEWQELNDFLGIVSTGQKMKVPEDHDPKWDGNNSSGFTALPSGVGYEDRFGRLGYWAVYWTSTERDEVYAWSTQLDNYWTMNKYPTLYQGNHFMKKNGFSVRCIKNTTEL